MTKLILPRRRFLFLAPAVIASSNLMPGHSVARLLAPPLRDFYLIARHPVSKYFPGAPPFLCGYTDIVGPGLGVPVLLTNAEIEYHEPRMTINGWSRQYYYPRGEG